MGPATADRARGGRRGHLGGLLTGVGRKGRDKPLFGHWLLELPGTQAEVEDGGAGDGGDLLMVSRGGKVVFEEILRQLKILQGGATENLDQGRADMFEIARDAEAGVKSQCY